MWSPFLSLIGSALRPQPNKSRDLQHFIVGMTFANASDARSVILYEGEKEMNLNRVIRMFVSMGIVVGAFSIASAQTTEQTVNVRMISTTTPEERVANEVKEKQLRKAAEEKNAAEEAARIEATSPKALLSHAHILHINSNTTYFEEVQLENALRKRNEIDQWQIAMIDGWGKRDVADTLVEIDRPFFTFTYTYKITNRNTGIILATGKLDAIDSNAAASMLADRIVEEIRKARGETKKK
jgi:hypothetical protein